MTSPATGIFGRPAPFLEATQGVLPCAPRNLPAAAAIDQPAAAGLCPIERITLEAERDMRTGVGQRIACDCARQECERFGVPPIEASASVSHGPADVSQGGAGPVVRSFHALGDARA